MKKKLGPVFTAIIFSCVLAAVLFYFYIFLAIGNHFYTSYKILFTLCALFLFAGPFFAYVQKHKFSVLCYSLVILNLVLIFVKESNPTAERLERQKIEDQINIQKNDELLKSALEVLNCDNGDVAILSMLNNSGSDRFSLSVQIIPKNRTGQSRILTSTDGRFIPPKSDWFENFKQSTQNDCHNDKYPSLIDVMERLNQHYQKEKIKYPH